MSKVKLCFLVLVIATLACGLFGKENGEEAPAETAPTEVVVISESTEEADIPEETELPNATEPPVATEITTSPKKDIPIEPKKAVGGQEATPAVTEVPIPHVEEDLPDGTEEFYYPYEVAQYQRGVEIEVAQLRILKRDYSDWEWIMGVINNTGAVDLYNITVYIFALDKDGEELGFTYTSAETVDFPIGSTNVFGTYFRGDGIPEGTDRLFVAFEGMERWEGTNSTRNFEILYAEGQSVPDVVYDVVYEITVSFKNLNENPTGENKVSAILYNKNGRLVGYGWVSLTVSEEDRTWAVLQPGEVTEITFECVYIYGNVDHFEFNVEGHQIFEY
jgi:hypothetical protein